MSIKVAAEISFKSFSFVPKGSDKKYTLDSKLRLNKCIKQYIDKDEQNYFKNTLVNKIDPLKTEVSVNFNNNEVSVTLPDGRGFIFDNSRYAEQLKKDERVVKYPTDYGYFDFKYRTSNEATDAVWDYNFYDSCFGTKSIGKLIVAKDIAKFYG